MKKFISVVALISIVAAPLFSQSQDSIDKLEALENQSEDKKTDETLEISVGNRTILIEESENKTSISISKKESRQNEVSRFRGHLGGIGIGYNGLLTDFWSTSLNPGDEYFDINSAKSLAWSFTFPEINIGITRRFGIMSGIGLSFNNYHFDNNNNIVKGEYGVISPLYPDQGIIYKKSKLHTTYINIPVMLELQIPTNGSSRNTLNISGGVVGAMKIGSKTKVVWNDGKRHKWKEKGDFSLNVLRWGTTARVGYNNFQVYGTTFFTPMFEKGKGPELYPFEVGMVFSFRSHSHNRSNKPIGISI
jgi:hypothetical protein